MMATPGQIAGAVAGQPAELQSVVQPCSSEVETPVMLTFKESLFNAKQAGWQCLEAYGLAASFQRTSIKSKRFEQLMDRVEQGTALMEKFIEVKDAVLAHWPTLTAWAAGVFGTNGS